MVLILAALQEELGVALDLCSSKIRLRIRGLQAWNGRRDEKRIMLLKTGVGPTRSERTLSLFLRSEKPSEILLVGYAGALDPALKLRDLVVGTKASLFDASRSGGTLQEARITGTWPLASAEALSRRAIQDGLSLHPGDMLTSTCIIGEPEQKHSLHQRLHAATIDMETAALARLAAEARIPLACVRVISDECQDTFLAPFSYDPSAHAISRAVKVLAAGNWVRRYGEWRERAAVARRSLRQFLAWYLDSYLEDSPRL